MSDRGIAAAAASSTGEAWIALLEIDHPSLAEPIRVCDNGENVISGGLTYVSWPFDLQLPNEDDNQPLARLIIDDIGQFTIDGKTMTIAQLLNGLTSAPTVVITVVLASRPDTAEFGPLDLTLRNVKRENQQIQGDLYLEDVLNEPYPGDTFNPATHPGLF